MFVHPSFPNQFTHIAHALGERRGWECACLVHEAFAEAVRRINPRIAYYGFREEATTTSGNYYTQSLEEGLRCGKAVMEALAHLQATERLDVVVGHATFGTTVFVRELVQIPVISYVELPGYFPLYCRQEFPALYPQPLLDLSLRALIHASVLHSDLCIVPSLHAKRLFPPELQGKIRVQPEGFVAPLPVRNRAKLRRDLGISSAGPVVGFAARTLEAVRGFDIFVKAAKRIRQARKDVEFLVIGDEATLYGNEMPYLAGKSFKQHVLETEGVEEQTFLFKPFMPHDQFMKHLQAMDVILFPLFEGAANWGLFEAMAAGVPILASRRCFVPEVITHNREGLLFDPDDVTAFSHATLQILAQPYRFRHLGFNARKKILHRYSRARAVEGYAAILEEVATVRRPAHALTGGRGAGD